MINEILKQPVQTIANRLIIDNVEHITLHNTDQDIRTLLIKNDVENKKLIIQLVFYTESGFIIYDKTLVSLYSENLYIRQVKWSGKTFNIGRIKETNIIETVLDDLKNISEENSYLTVPEEDKVISYKCDLLIRKWGNIIIKLSDKPVKQQEINEFIDEKFARLEISSDSSKLEDDDQKSFMRK